MIAKRKLAEQVLTLWDRLVYGCIAAMFGVIVGFVSAVLAFFAIGHSNWNIVPFSAVFFLGIGFLHGAFVGDFVGDALTRLFGIGAAEAGIPPEGLKGSQGRLAVALIVAYLAGVVLLVWRA